MGGYKRARTVKLTWADDTELAGFEVRAKRISVRKFLALAPLLEADLASFSKEEVDQMEDLFLMFGRELVSWNLEDEDTGEPIPCTPDAFLDADLPLAVEIITAYGQNVAGVSPPLDGGSPSGDQSQEASIPMEPLSPSPAS
ncbi:hypothetical protein AB0C27_40490 [Nonomuraea sp. NPDC048882]|uniref:hypothetical protein n=1 Tax=Nonomuraea sp. NPDC048882 TaxID=3154347 RepID=UPI0033DB7AB5